MNVKIRYMKALQPSSHRQADTQRTPAFEDSDLSVKIKNPEQLMLFWIFGPSVEIRTRGLLNPIQARYQTSPHPDASVDCQNILAHRLKKSKYFFRHF